MFTIHLLGKFQITYDGLILDSDMIRSEMIVKLLSFLVVHRDRSLTVNELADVLWQEDETDNPAGALKNLMYRLRTILKKYFGDGDFIVTSRGAYAWNSQYEVTVDAEEFEKYCDSVTKLKDITKKISHYEKAIDLYQGDFLAKYASINWIVPLTTYYHSLFLSIVKKLAKLYRETGQYEKMEKTCAYALRYDNIDEKLHCYLIESFIYQNKLELANEYYERAEKILYDTLGVRESAKLREVHNGLMQMQKSAEAVEMNEINEDMVEEEPEGAFICGYPIFREIYRLESRRIARLGISEYVLLITVCMKKQAKSEDNEQYNKYHIKKAMECLGKALKESLRIGDVAARYSNTQYIVLLPTLDYEDSVMIAGRIESNMYDKIKNARIRLKSDISEVTTTEAFGK